MSKRKETKHSSASRTRQVRLPGFLIEKELGLGDAIKRATSGVGIRPCAGCERRAVALNRWLVFTGWR
jgi:hypothetical protein